MLQNSLHNKKGGIAATLYFKNKYSYLARSLNSMPDTRLNSTLEEP